MRSVSVSQVNQYIANKLRSDLNLKNIPVEGEISGLNKRGKHCYLTLKDSECVISCAIWQSYLKNIDTELLENGKKILALCDISPYEKNGTYSLSIKAVEAVGIGEIMAEFNRIKKKLEEEGLFDKKYKKEIPLFPYRIGVVTSPDGAAVHDIMKIVTSKNKLTDIVIFPSIVQGANSAASLIESIEIANEYSKNVKKIDTLIVGRGGGSAEDLMSFNDEGLARAIFASKIPVISAVGHETDIHISDFVADYSAETPTKAADYAVPDTDDLYYEIENNKKRLTDSLSFRIKTERQKLESYCNLLYSNIKAKTAQEKLLLEKAMLSLKENNPKNIFSKGYSAVLDENEKLISSVDDVEVGAKYRIMLNDGTFDAQVVSKKGN